MLLLLAAGAAPALLLGRAVHATHAAAGAARDLSPAPRTTTTQPAHHPAHHPAPAAPGSVYAAVEAAGEGEGEGGWTSDGPEPSAGVAVTLGAVTVACPPGLTVILHCGPPAATLAAATHKHALLQAIYDGGRIFPVSPSPAIASASASATATALPGAVSVWVRGRQGSDWNLEALRSRVLYLRPPEEEVGWGGGNVLTCRRPVV